MRALIVAICVLVGCVANAQDVVFKTNGEQIAAKVIEVSKSEIRYKLENDSTGPIYVLPKVEIYMVEYASGRKEVFASENAAVKDSVSLKRSEERREKTAKLKLLYNKSIGGVVAGSIGIAVGTPFLIITVKDVLSGRNKSIARPIMSGFGALVGVFSLAAGVDGLVRASVYKEQLRNMPVAINPVLIEGMSYNGASIQHNSAIGIGVSVSF